MTLLSMCQPPFLVDVGATILPIEVAIGEEASAASNGWPASFPARLLGGIERNGMWIREVGALWGAVVRQLRCGVLERELHLEIRSSGEWMVIANAEGSRSRRDYLMQIGAGLPITAARETPRGEEAAQGGM